MATSFTLDQTGTTWEVKLTNCVSGTVFETSDIDTVSIVFTKENGETFSKVAELVEDTENAGEFFIQYRNIPPEDSILDLIGVWSFAGAGVLIDESTFRTSEKKVFWVVP